MEDNTGEALKKILKMIAMKIARAIGTKIIVVITFMLCF